MLTKSVLITGASRGIGRACAISFSQAGYLTFINCRKSLDEIQLVKNEILDSGGQCNIVIGDVSNPLDVKYIFQQIESICLGLDVLVNNAGISYVGLLSEMTDSQWDNLISTNLSSAFYCSKAAIPHMVKEKRGKIINISSIWGNVGASCEVAYSASKSGLNGLTKALAKELAPSNIQVNAISCGVIDTNMNDYLSDEERISLIKAIPASRLGTANEVATLALNLAENHPYLTGQIISLDGGLI